MAVNTVSRVCVLSMIAMVSMVSRVSMISTFFMVLRFLWLPWFPGSRYVIFTECRAPAIWSDPWTNRAKLGLIWIR